MTESDQIVYKEKIVRVFSEFIRICDQHDLQYFCCGGTAIGTVRHQGMIPWDDDIDLLMPRPDYERFLSIFSSLRLVGYELIIPNAQSNYYLPYAKMCDSQTTLIEDENLPCVLGAFIDIFPLDCTISDKGEWQNLLTKYKRLSNKLMTLGKKSGANLSDLPQRFFKGQIRTFWNELSLAFGKVKKRKKILQEINSLVAASGTDKCEFVVNYGGMWGIREFALSSWFSSYCIMNFEGLDVRMPIGYHEYLTNLYGDYMELPPIEKRKSHHNHAVLDLNKRITNF